MSIKLGTKKRSVYYFSFIKLKVSTFLVYKVKKCLLKSGKVNWISGEVCPEALPNFARSLGQSCPTTAVTFVHRFGHAYSCTWALVLMYIPGFPMIHKQVLVVLGIQYTVKIEKNYFLHTHYLLDNERCNNPKRVLHGMNP